MGIRFYKSINLGGGTRVNLSKSGVGFSWGTKGFRMTKKAGGGGCIAGMFMLFWWIIVGCFWLMWQMLYWTVKLCVVMPIKWLINVIRKKKTNAGQDLETACEKQESE